jgi:hypothetical protein
MALERIMELYFNDFDAEPEAPESTLGPTDSLVEADLEAEEIAFAELTERVSAARLVY